MGKRKAPEHAKGSKYSTLPPFRLEHSVPIYEDKECTIKWKDEEELTTLLQQSKELYKEEVKSVMDTIDNFLEEKEEEELNGD